MEPSSATESALANFFEVKSDRSAVKHAILERYFEAWLAIISQAGHGWTPVYVDGFAGPGQYEDGKGGSPLLIYKAAMKHSLSYKFKEPLSMIFIEFDGVCATKLRANLEATKAQLTGEGEDTSKVIYTVLQGKFNEQMKDVLEGLHNLSALLAFVDPFAYKGEVVPMELMRKIIARADYAPTELFVLLMDGFANRSFSTDSKANAIHTFLGTPDWRLRVLPHGEELSPAERIKRFVENYIQQLSKETSTELYPLKFGMRSLVPKNRHVYTLLFVTRHDIGLKEMKAAMWNQTQLPNDFEFSEFKHQKGEEVPDNFNKLADSDRKAFWTKAVQERLMEEFAGRGPTTGMEMEKFITRNTIYQFNVKRELKKVLKDFITIPNSKFENIVFVIPNVEAAKAGAEVMQP